MFFEAEVAASAAVGVLGQTRLVVSVFSTENDKPAAAAKRTDPVAGAQRSDAAVSKAARKRAADSTPVHSFTSLLADLATICANQIQPVDDTPAFTMISGPPRYSAETSNY